MDKVDIPGYMIAANDSGTTLAPAPSKPSGDAFTSLYPAIVECFTIILLGYITGRGGWITSSQAKGLNTFTSKFALPALLFSSMATLDWTVVEWTFVVAVFISKAIVFLVAFVFTLFLKRPLNLGLAALAGIFVTQSNDFALGYPIVRAIYSQTEPQFLQYIYLVAPISLLILNPIGFIMLDIHKAKHSSVKRSNCRLVLNILKEITTNPIIVMTALGVVANFIFNHKLPLLIDNLLSTLGQAFSACALFILGLSIVGKFKKSMRPILMGSGLLIFVKLLLLPMITVGMTKALGCGTSKNSTAQYSMFAFLYGTFPTAPSVFLYASQYGVGMDLVATALVLGTVASAPLMFTSAMMFGMQVFTMDVAAVLQQTIFDVAVVALICSVAVVLLFLVTKRGASMPQMMVLVIALLQLLITVGCIIDSSMPPVTGNTLLWWEYVKVILFSYGMLGVSAMTTVTAVTIYCISCHSLCRALVFRPWLLFYGIGSPILLMSVVLIIGSVRLKPDHTIMPYGQVQMSVLAAFMLINIAATIVTLILRHRHALKSLDDADESKNDTSQSTDRTSSFNSYTSEESNITVDSDGSRKCYGACDSVQGCSDELDDSYKMKTSNRHKSKKDDKQGLFPASADIEDIVPFPSSSNTAIQDERMCLLSDKCTPEKLRKCKTLLERYDGANGDNVYIEGYQLGRVMALIVILIFCQITALFFYVWALFFSDMSSTGLFVELEFIYTVLSTGQGFFTFVTFGLDSEVVLMPVKRLIVRIISKIKGRKQATNQPSEQSLLISQQFTDHHLSHCIHSIEKIPGTKTVCFSGAVFITWLINAGLAFDRTEAQMYADHLILGGVIKSCSKRNIELLDSNTQKYQFRKPLSDDLRSA